MAEHLKHIFGFQNLALKVGCRVMLVKNLSDSLVNGLQGKVVLLEKDEVSVKFSHIENVIKLKAELFTK